MLRWLRTLQRNWHGDKGASAVEYALLVVAVALVMIAGAVALGDEVSTRLNESSGCVAGTTVATC